MTSTLSAADLRAERARLQVPIFILASSIGVHPYRLGQMLNERRALTSAMAVRIAKALREIGSGHGTQKSKTNVR